MWVRHRQAITPHRLFPALDPPSTPSLPPNRPRRASLHARIAHPLFPAISLLFIEQNPENVEKIT
jgi:hypothetical protein